LANSVDATCQKTSFLRILFVIESRRSQLSPNQTKSSLEQSMDMLDIAADEEENFGLPVAEGIPAIPAVSTVAIPPGGMLSFCNPTHSLIQSPTM
jgi:hypothetical protein